MKKTFYLIAIIALLISSVPTGCRDTQTRTIKASGSYVMKEIKNLGSFTGIRLYGRPDVEFRQSKEGETTVYVYAPTNLVDLVETTAPDETLYIKIDERIKIVGKAKIRIIVSAPVLSHADLIGSGDIVILGPLKGQKINLSIRGSGDISAENIECQSLDLNIMGSGDVNFKKLTCHSLSVQVMGSGDVGLLGSAGEARFAVKGSGDISAKRMVVKEVKAEVFGSGDVSCYPLDQLDAEVFGSGEITYVGNPGKLHTVGNRKNIRRVK